MPATQERPVHVVLAGAEVRTVPVADDEWAQMQAVETAAAETLQQAATARQADLETVAARAAQDPAIAALVRLLGIALPEAGSNASA